MKVINDAKQKLQNVSRQLSIFDSFAIRKNLSTDGRISNYNYEYKLNVRPYEGERNG